MSIRRKLFSQKYCIQDLGKNSNQHIRLRRHDRQQPQNYVLQSRNVYLKHALQTRNQIMQVYMET